MSKPITLLSHASGPNPWKVAIILEELGLKYETKYLDMSTFHTPVFEKYNPNGRVPVIEDPNTGITLWESGAIIQYLLEEYDTEYKLHFKASPEKYLASQYLFFQVSGQGPYFGQAMWFARFHHEKLPSAIERFQNEIRRVTKVLDSCLEGKEWLVGNKCSYADLSFVTWYLSAPFADSTGQLAKDLDAMPNYKAWMSKMLERPSVKKIIEEKAKQAH